MNPAPKSERATEQIVRRPLGNIHPSPFQTRRLFRKLDEMAASIVEVGVIEPMVVRPHPTSNDPNDVELVCGERRLRGSQLAKIPDAPVVIRNLSDEQAKTILAVENIQRDDPHPLEEAEAMEQLLGVGWSAEYIAAKIGKSKSHVYQRLKLLELGPEAREAFYAATLSPSVALHVARVPASLQVEALKLLDEEAKENAEWDPYTFDKKTHLPKPGTYEPLGARDAARLLRDRFTLRLVDAPFDRGDANLVPSAGSCASCPKRSGNQTELFASADVSTPDLCTDPTCFAEKKKAAAASTIAKLESKGTTVVEAKGERFGEPKPPAGYVAVDRGAYCSELGKPWSEVLKGKKVQKAVEESGRVVMLDAKNKPVQVVKKSEVLEAAGYDPKKPRSSSGGYKPETPEQIAKRELEAKAERQGYADAMGFLVAKVVDGGLTDPLVRLLCQDGIRDAGLRRGWKRTKGSSDWNPRFEEVGKLKGAALLGLLAEVLLGSDDHGFEEACKLFKIDPQSYVRTELVRLKAIATAEQATKPSAGAKASKKGGAKPARKAAKK